MKKFLVSILLMLMFITPSTSIAYAEGKSVDNTFLEVTKGMVYHANGGIYVVTQYRFDLEGKYTYTQDGETFTLTYNDIIPKIIALMEKAQIQYVYKENNPNVLAIINKHYNNRTEMNHDLGITGNEVEPPPECVSDFWFKTYISTSETYLANGGLENLKKIYEIQAQQLLNIANPVIDFSKIKFNYCYGTDFKSITSNATRVEYNKQEGMYYHIFEDIKEDSSIILYQQVPNTPNWYGIIIGVSLLVVLIGVILVVVKRRKNG